MSVLIKDMEMPRACVFCELYDGDLYWCRGAKKEVPYSPEDKRAEFCPLIPVPPHGDLIEKSAIEKTIENSCAECEEMCLEFDGLCADCDNCALSLVKKELTDTPTIISADEMI